MTTESSPTIAQDGHCALCGGSNFTLLYPLEKPVHKCARCNLIQRLREDADPAYGENIYLGEQKNYWIRQYRDWKKSEDIPHYRWALDHAEESLKKSSQPLTLLDIGCGLGTFMKYAESRGWKPTGTELSRFAISHIKNKLSLEATPAQDLSAFEDRSFDLVTLWDVLEHTRSVRNVLHEARRVIKKDGLLVIRTINEKNIFNFIAVALWKMSNRVNFILRMHEEVHVVYFTHDLLSRFIKTSGFQELSRRDHDLPAHRVARGMIQFLAVSAINFLQSLFSGTQFERILICKKVTP